MDRQNYFFVILAFCMLIYTGSSLKSKSYTACYGILGLENYLQPSCPGDQKMVVVAVYALAKHKSTGCPQVQIQPIDPSCCQYDPEDCSVFYDSGPYRNYYQTCNGKSSCAVPVSWIDIPSHCNSSVYIERTHYMKMDYYCISDQAVDPCKDLTTSDSPTFFWNSGYPAEMTSTSTSCTCSIEMSCDTTVQLTAIDLQFKDAGNCTQSFSVTNGNSYSIFDCSNNNDFLPNMIYTSSGHFMKIVFVNNFGTTGGKFFIQVQGSNPTGEVTLSCGASASTVSSQNSSTLPTCPVEGSTTTNIPSIWPSTTNEDSATLTALSTDSSTISPTISLIDSTTATTLATENSTTSTAQTTKDSTKHNTPTTEESTTPTTLTTENSTTSTNLTTEDSKTHNTLTTEDPTKPTTLTTEYPTISTILKTEDSTTSTALTNEDPTTPTTLTNEYPTISTILKTEDSTTSTALTNEDPTTPTTLTTEESKSSTTLTNEYPTLSTILKTEDSTTSTAMTTDVYPASPTALTNGDSIPPTEISNMPSTVSSSISPFVQTEDSTTLTHLPVTTQTTDSSIVSATIFPNVQTEVSTPSSMSTESTPLPTQDATTSRFSLNMTTMFNVSIQSTSDVAPKHSTPPQMSTDLPTVTATEPTTNNFLMVVLIVIGTFVAIVVGVVCFIYYLRNQKTRSAAISIPLSRIVNR